MSAFAKQYMLWANNFMLYGFVRSGRRHSGHGEAMLINKKCRRIDQPADKGIIIMEESRKGTVVINEIKTKGLFKKYNQYGGGLKGAPGIYGYSLKQDLNKEYHRGDEVCVRYWIYMGGKKDDYDEVMEFEIVE